MSAETLFSVTNTLALAAWILLIFAPRWRWTRRLVHSGAVPLLLAFAYVVLVVLFLGDGEGGFGSIAEVSMLFANDWVLLAGWIHYLAFDLWVGAWEVSDSEKKGVPHYAVIPCLILTFLLGPAGLLAYFVVRAGLTREIRHENF